MDSTGYDPLPNYNRSLAIRRGHPGLRGFRAGAGGGRGVPEGGLRSRRRLAPPRPRQRDPLPRPVGPVRCLSRLPRGGPPAGPNRGRGLDGSPDGTPRRLRREVRRPVAHRGDEVDGSLGRQRSALGLGLRAGPPAAARLLLLVAAPRPSPRRGDARVRRHPYGRRGLDRRPVRNGHGRPRRRGAPPAASPHLARPGSRPGPQAPGGGAHALPPHGAPAHPGKAHRRDRARRARGRESAGSSSDRHRQDGGRPLPRHGRRADRRPPGRLPDGQDTSADDGRQGARGHERARLHHAPDPRQGADVRQRPDPLPRAVLPFREGLSGEDGAVGHPLAPSRLLSSPGPGHCVRGGPQRGGLPLRGAAGAGAACRRHRGRLQLRLRAGRGPAPSPGRGSTRRHPPRRRGAQPARPRQADLLAGAPRGGLEDALEPAASCSRARSSPASPTRWRTSSRCCRARPTSCPKATRSRR